MAGDAFDVPACFWLVASERVLARLWPSGLPDLYIIADLFHACFTWFLPAPGLGWLFSSVAPMALFRCGLRLEPHPIYCWFFTMACLTSLAVSAAAAAAWLSIRRGDHGWFSSPR